MAPLTLWQFSSSLHKSSCSCSHEPETPSDASCLTAIFPAKQKQHIPFSGFVQALFTPNNPNCYLKLRRTTQQPHCTFCTDPRLRSKKGPQPRGKCGGQYDGLWEPGMKPLAHQKGHRFVYLRTIRMGLWGTLQPHVMIRYSCP